MQLYEKERAVNKRRRATSVTEEQETHYTAVHSSLSLSLRLF